MIGKWNAGERGGEGAPGTKEARKKEKKGGMNFFCFLLLLFRI
jgi:hypothetical protein